MASPTPKERRPHINDGLDALCYTVRTAVHQTQDGPRVELETTENDYDPEFGEDQMETNMLLTPDEAVLLATWLLQRAEECRR